MASWAEEDDEDEERHESFALHNAAEAGDLEQLRALLNIPADGVPDADFVPVRTTRAAQGGFTIASHVSQKEKVEGEEQEEPEEKEELDVDARDEHGCTPLHLALLNGAPGISQLCRALQLTRHPRQARPPARSCCWTPAPRLTTGWRASRACTSRLRTGAWRAARSARSPVPACCLPAATRWTRLTTRGAPRCTWLPRWARLRRARRGWSGSRRGPPRSW